MEHIIDCSRDTADVLRRIRHDAERACLVLGESDRLAEYLQLLQARRVDAIVLSGATSMNAVELQTLEACLQ